MNLKHISDNILRTDSKKAALLEREKATLLLHYIQEVDRRKLFSDWKYTSLFDWCVKELNLCEGSAHLRITAARMMAKIPQLESKIKEGKLTLSHIALVNQHCRENGIENKTHILQQVENLTKREAEKKLFELSGKEKPAKEGKKRISCKKHEVTFILSDETLDAIEEVKRLIGKKISADDLMKMMAATLKEKIKKEKFKQVEKPKKSKGTQGKGRNLSAEVKRNVYMRDKKCVQCGSNHNLNFDHVIPFALGGPNTEGNIRLLCFHCNQRARMRMGLLHPGEVKTNLKLPKLVDHPLSGPD